MQKSHSVKALHRFPQTLGVAELKGTAAQLYTRRRLDQVSETRLYSWMLANGIPNPVAPNTLHASVIRALNNSPGYCPDRRRIRLQPNSYKISVLGPALVLRFASDEIERQWFKAKQAGAVMEFSDFIPHISLTYRMNDGYDWSALSTPNLPVSLEPEELVAFNKEFAEAA